MDKDKSIITQVAAKIAAELATSDKDINTAIASFADAFDAVTELLMGSIYNGGSTIVNDEATFTQAFPQATTQEFEVRIKNDAQGPIPSWLTSACKRDGVTEVYDNRADLAANPKRPWFKAVNDKEKAYWPPKGA
jgi:DNA-binding transcriptional MocR family regulator